MCIVGIATFVDAVESSLNRIACETVLSERTRAHVGILAISRASGPVTKAHPRARGHSALLDAGAYTGDSAPARTWAF